jgi:predicted SAM-dependent methyltransferase
MTFLEKLEKKIKDVSFTYLPTILPTSSLKVECPFCGWKGPSFLPNGLIVRKNSRCPKCDSLERHRLYYLYLKEVFPTNKKVKVLHFAPEKILTMLFRSFKNVDYLSADIAPGKAMVVADITQTSFEDNAFDVIFCSHVLEHVPDDAKAMRELYRILAPDGFAILQVPVKTSWNGKPVDKTYEDFSITDPKEREKAFGQHDHVRIYGTDFKDRLAQAGFTVKLVKYADQVGEAALKRYALLPELVDASETEGWIYHCTK